MNRFLKKILIFFCCVTGLVLCYSGRDMVYSGVVNIIAWSTYPVIKLQQACLKPIKRALLRRHTLAELEDLVGVYKNSTQALLAEIIELKSAQNYGSALEEIKLFEQRYHQKPLCTTQIILKHYAEDEHFFLVDAGAQCGITPDMVVVYKNCLLGRVVEVYPYYAKVLAVTDKKMRIPVACADTKANGIFEGMHEKNNARVAYMSHLQKIQEQDLVITRGDGLVYPAGFAVGRIVSCQLDEMGITYNVGVEVLFNLDEIEYCSVIQKGAEHAL